MFTWRDYPYLCLALMLAMAAAAILVLTRRHRKFLQVSGLLSITFGLFSYEFIPAYWNPRVLFHWIASPEDLIFSFATGVIAGFAVLLPHWSRWQFASNWQLSSRRFISCSGAGIAAFLVLRTLFGQTNVMYATLLAIVGLASCLSWLRRDLVTCCTFSGLAFMLFYGLVLLVSDKIWPDFTDCWSPAAQLPFAHFGLPSFELAWAACYGFCWPLLMAYICEARIVAAAPPSAS